MKNAIILHGKPGKKEYYSEEYPSASNSHWIPWLQKQLLINDIKADTPEIPHAYNPVYEVWKREFERFDISPKTILVGHSCGGGFLVRWLSENPEQVVNKVVLVAPWLDPARELDTGMFNFRITQNLVQQTKDVTIFNSTNDQDSIKITVEKLKNEISDIKYKEFKNYGHFCLMDMKSEAFPELLDEILNS